MYHFVDALRSAANATAASELTSAPVTISPPPPAEVTPAAFADPSASSPSASAADVGVTSVSRGGVTAVAEAVKAKQQEALWRQRTKDAVSVRSSVCGKAVKAVMQQEALWRQRTKDAVSTAGRVCIRLDTSARREPNCPACQRSGTAKAREPGSACTACARGPLVCGLGTFRCDVRKDVCLFRFPSSEGCCGASWRGAQVAKLEAAVAALPPDGQTVPGSGLGLYSPAWKLQATHALKVRLSTSAGATREGRGVVGAVQSGLRR